jgi:hypothetical protein
VAEFRRYRPDVTLMDLRLPGTTGIDVLIAIRGKFPRARIIMLPTLQAQASYVFHPLGEEWPHTSPHLVSRVFIESSRIALPLRQHRIAQLG